MGSTRHTLLRRIARIQQALAGLGPLRPGNLYVRRSVCGKPGCRCVRPKNPIRHGPYYYLSYTLGGRSHTEFIPSGKVAAVKMQCRNYNRLTSLVKRLIETNILLSRLPEEGA
jgi:hypothetical protein